MLLSLNVKVHRVLNSTWKNFIFSLLTCSVAFLINEFWLKNYFVFPTFIPTVLGTALAFFIGFNNNQAYDRWWEARKIWGSLVNNSRTWGRMLINYTHPTEELPDAELKEKIRIIVRNHIGFLYALKANLRKSEDTDYKAFLSIESVAEVSVSSNIHNAILEIQARELALLQREGVIDGYKFIEINRTLTEFCNEMGKSERIKNTVYPTTYTYFSRLFIWFFVYSITMTAADAVGLWAVAFGSLVGYVFFTIQAIGQVLLNPFDKLPTGIPLDQITRTIEINLLEMLGEKNIPEPIKPYKGEYVL